MQCSDRSSTANALCARVRRPAASWPRFGCKRRALRRARAARGGHWPRWRTQARACAALRPAAPASELRHAAQARCRRRPRCRRRSSRQTRTWSWQCSTTARLSGSETATACWACSRHGCGAGCVATGASPAPVFVSRRSWASACLRSASQSCCCLQPCCRVRYALHFACATRCTDCRAVPRLAADASFVVWLMKHMRLEQALAVVAAIDLVVALVLLVLLVGRRDAQRGGMLVKRPALPGSALTAALERAFQHTLAQYDGGTGEPHEL